MESPLSIRAWLATLVLGWQRFWFVPAAPHTLALMRILSGAMIFYTHVVWAKDLTAFLGPNAWIDRETARLLNPPYAWSHLYYIESPALLWTVHLAALAVFASFTLGLFTRISSVLTALLTLSYCHRLVGAQFGLDQVNAMLAMYLAIAPSGEVYSLDRYLAERKAGKSVPVRSSVAGNIAMRLIQLHMCVIYLFGGISKLRGDMWWDGRAVWFAVANYEYQSLDVTWLVHAPWLIALLSHVTVFWETFYCAAIWPRATRPVWLALAVAVHGGIALFLGMITFGLAMIIANLAFVPPEMTERVLGRISMKRRGGATSEVTGSLLVERSRVDVFHNAVG